MRLERTTIILVLLTWLLTPDVLCLMPGVELLASEAECCKRMAGDCGNTKMPVSHWCCKTLARPDTVTLGKSLDLKSPHDGAAVELPVIASIVHAVAASFHWLSFSHSPPELGFASTLILRI